MTIRITRKSTQALPRSRTEIVVTFLAVLELIRLRQIDVAQESSFAPIELVRAAGSAVVEPEPVGTDELT